MVSFNSPSAIEQLNGVVDGADSELLAVILQQKRLFNEILNKRYGTSLTFLSPSYHAFIGSTFNPMEAAKTWKALADTPNAVTTVEGIEREVEQEAERILLLAQHTA